jgi:hypothetical protein
MFEFLPPLAVIWLPTRLTGPLFNEYNSFEWASFAIVPRQLS